MKNYWQQQFGPAGWLNKTRRERIITTLLSPFFLVMLAGVFVADLLAFGGRMIERSFVAWGQLAEDELANSQLPDLLKTGLRRLIPWTATVVVAGLTGGVLVGVAVTSEGEIGNWSEGQQAQAETVAEVWIAPAELSLASEAAKIKLSAGQIQNLLEQWRQDERQNLTQKEKINLALAYYYLGDEGQYRRWLDEARLMDPNEVFFRN